MKKWAFHFLSLPDLFTILNGLLGIGAIFSILSNHERMAFSLILLAVLADGLDGFIARKIGKKFGKYMDGLSDITSFCVAPSIFAYYKWTTAWATAYGNAYEVFVVAIIFSFIICGMSRLLRFYMIEQDGFIGITTPAAAIVISTTIYCSRFPPYAFPPLILLLTIVGMSILMVSPIPYPKVKGWSALIAVILIFFAVIFGDRAFAPLSLLCGTFIYIIGGPFYQKFSK
jgi:CDP-diacylglycerol--serine O-phosphatidyltransferase